MYMRVIAEPGEKDTLFSWDIERLLTQCDLEQMKSKPVFEMLETLSTKKVPEQKYDILRGQIPYKAASILSKTALVNSCVVAWPLMSRVRTFL